MTPIAELKIDEMSATVRDVKGAQAELVRLLKEYIDAKVLCEIALADNDPDYSAYIERQKLEAAEQKLKLVINRAE